MVRKPKFEPITAKASIAPKSRPIIYEKWGTISRIRLPFDGPLSPGLCGRNRVSAIGFTANLKSDESDG